MAEVLTEKVDGYVIHTVEQGARSRNIDARIPPIRIPSRGGHSPISPRHPDFPRSASYTYLPVSKPATYVPTGSMPRVKPSFTEADLLGPGDYVIDISPPESSGCSTPEDERTQLELKVPKPQQVPDLAAELEKSPKLIRVPRSSAIEDDGSSDQFSVRRASIASTSKESMNTVSTVPTTPIIIARQRGSVNSSFSRTFNRKSWYSTSPSTISRSPSPPKTEIVSRIDLDSPDIQTQDAAAILKQKSRNRKSLLRRRDSLKVTIEKKTDQNPSTIPGNQRPAHSRSLSLKKTLFRNASRESLRGPGIAHVQIIPPMPAFPKSFSTDKLPTFRSNLPLPDRAAPMPRILSNERLTTSSSALPKKKDELWNVFRTLDGDYTKFSSKSTAFKANVVRTALIPFLRQYVLHPSNKSLRPEDLDRRTNILNKWWTGLIEMLHGRNNQSISGTDRPVILDGISGIMERPEWRKSPQFSPLSQRAEGQSSAFNYPSSTSLASTNSEFLTESVHTNVRNIFIQNLSAQMAFVVDKMSLRNASASLVTFCGKACAYAFIFVPGMADVLVRLWDLPMETIKKVLDEADIGKFDNLAQTASKVTSVYPPALHQLSFDSLMKLMRKLRTPPPLPLGTANIQWWGHWLDRWTGRESDLFYVFVKHYHILAVDFLALNASKTERMCAPGMVLVHAQILTNLDATIHRDAAPVQQDPSMMGASAHFGDVLTDPDAVATALPVAPMNAVRMMAENRLIMLIRDFLSDRSGEHPVAQLLFAESFNDLLHASARGTSVYDHAACYTLLDFLEEALLILVRFEHFKESEGVIINSAFWQSVCKRMISSHNSMTEIRLYAFLYTIWNSVVCDLGRKANLCLGLLLDPEIFESRFNHWCPMVRAYYMRLLCWRVGRFDGEASAGDLLIYETMLDRLKSTWSHYVYLCEDAARKNTLPPATNPCNPAPGRKLLIMRTDLQAATGGSFMSFDGIVPKPGLDPSRPISRRFSSLSFALQMDPQADSVVSSEMSEAVELRDKGIGGFFRKMMGGSKTRGKTESTTTQAPKSRQGPAGIPELRLVRSATDDGQLLQPRASFADIPMRSPGTSASPYPQLHRNFTFKFSLDDHNNKQVPGPMRLLPPRLPLPAQIFLQENSSKSGDAVSPHSFSAVEPQGASIAHARYCGRALAEWMMVVGECQSFFERRKSEGVPGNKFVETPTMGVEVFRRPS